MSKTNKEQNYTESDLIIALNLTRISLEYTPLMEEWTNAEADLNEMELALLKKLWLQAKKNITGWKEEDLKMKFLGPILSLSNLMYGDKFETYFEKTVSATIEGVFLKTKTDFMIAKGILDKPQKPYFHFQEWKPHKNPTGDSMAQLLEALLVAQEVNKHAFPMYGCEVVGKQWSFVILEGKSYCISQTYDSTKEAELLQIVAILRKFKEILETRMLDK